MERVVTRSDIQEGDDQSQHGQDSQLDDARNLSILGELQFVDVAPKQVGGNGGTAALDGEDDEGFDFRLFAGDNSASIQQDTDAKVRIGTPLTSMQDGAFVHPQRPMSFYFAGSEPKVRSNFISVALTGKEILARSKESWPGFAYSWKVMHVTVPEEKHQDEKIVALVDGTQTPRRRPGKKARIKTRVKLANVKALQERTERENQEREALDREKRTRRNREKKVKKKAREKAKKSEAPVLDVAGSAG